MKARVILSIVVLMFGLTAAMFPNKRNDSLALNERELLQEMLLESNYISVDELADLLIQGDPSIRLIDVRKVEDYNNPLPRAMNVPIDSVFSDNYSFLFDQSLVKNILYAEDDRLATQVWMIVRQQGFANNYLLKGGLQAWQTDILNPRYPGQEASSEAFDLYQQRMAAKQYFTGVKALPKVQIEPIVPMGGKKKKRVAGGCS